MPPFSRSTDVLIAVAAVVVAAYPVGASAAGFEVGEHTTLSTARGGTGVVSKDDPSALYFNPSLLPTADGFQGMTDFGLVDYNLTFERDDLTYRKGNQQRTKTFDTTIENQTPFTPAPSAGISFDFGLDNFGAGIGVFAPHGAQKRCYGDRQDDGTCAVDRQGPGRHMLVFANLIEVYAMAGAGYEFDLPDGAFRIGASAIAAHQQIDFKIVVNSQLNPKSPWEEDPETESVINATDLTSWNFLGVVGASYESDGFSVAASYRPPTRWKSTGTGTVDFPQTLDNLGVELTDPTMTFVTWQAGSLRLGWRYAHGTHPGRPDAPKFDLEFNGIWEDWSRVKKFELRPEGDIESTKTGATADLRPFVQRKNWRDTFSIRFGGSWGALPWLTLHGGTYFETAAVPLAYTHLDFGSWERIAGSLGASLHPTDWLDIKLAFMHIASPTRRVRQGEIYNKVPTSPCSGPDYTDDACSAPGQPPGNPQNEGTWNVNYNIGSVGLTLRFD